MTDEDWGEPSGEAAVELVERHRVRQNSAAKLRTCRDRAQSSMLSN